MPAPRNQRGAAVVDFVLVLVILLPLFMGVLQLALVLHVRNTLAAAASEGARAAATLDGTPALGVSTAQEQIREVVSAKFARNVTIQSVSVQGAPGYRVTIQAEVSTLGLGGPGIGVSVSGSAIREQP